MLGKIHKESLKNAGLKSGTTKTRNRVVTIEELGYKRRIKILNSTVESMTQTSHFNQSKNSKPFIQTYNQMLNTSSSLVPSPLAHVRSHEKNVNQSQKMSIHDTNDGFKMQRHKNSLFDFDTSKVSSS